MTSQQQCSSVWVVVNTKIPLVQVFEKKSKAFELVNQLRKIEEEKWGNVTYTLFVERNVRQ